jgi:hypothetical protein
LSRRGRNRKGISPTVGAAFFLAAVLIIFNALFIVSSRYDSFVSDLMTSRLAEDEKRKENISTLSIEMANQRLNLTLSNKGGQPTRIVSIWVSEWNETVSNWHRSYAVDVVIHPGGTATNIGQTFAGTLDPRLTYSLRIVTARGRVFASTYSPLAGQVYPGFINFGFLSISFEQDSFLYSPEDEWWWYDCDLYPAWDIHELENWQNIVWHVKVVNHGLQAITLYKWTAMTLLKISKSGGSSSTQEPFYIVDPDVICDADGDEHVTPYNVSTDPYVIQPNAQNDTQIGGPPEWIKFAAKTPGDNDVNQPDWDNTEWMVFMMFYYRYGDEVYTQIIPFAGVNIADIW